MTLEEKSQAYAQSVFAEAAKTCKKGETTITIRLKKR